MFATTKSASRLSTRTALGVETLEAREVPAVLNAIKDSWDNVHVITSGATNVSINQMGSTVQVKDNVTGRAWDFTTLYPSSLIYVYGSESADRIVNNAPALRLVAY